MRIHVSINLYKCENIILGSLSRVDNEDAIVTIAGAFSDREPILIWKQSDKKACQMPIDYCTVECNGLP